MPTLTPNYSLFRPLVNDPTDQDLWGGYLNTNMDTIDTTMKSISDSVTSAVPVGTVFDYAGSTAPTNYLFAYGQAISRTTYSALFAVIGTTFGNGDGSTTFNLPDLRGRVGVGKDDMGGTAANRVTTAGSSVDGLTLGATGGAQNVTLTTAQMPKHRHFIAAALQTTGAAGAVNATNQITQGNDTGGSATYTLSGTSTDATIARTSETGGDTAHTNMQPSIIVNKIIKVL